MSEFFSQPVQSTPEKDGWSLGTKIAVWGGGGALTVAALTGGSYELFWKDGHGAVAEASPNSPEVNCDTFNFANAAADVTKYDGEAFLPHDSDVTGNDDVQGYVDSLFDNDGPLAGQGDEGSMAFIDAAVTEPAQDHAVFNPNRSVAKAFDDKMNAYNSSDGASLITKTDAENIDKKGDCAESYQVISQVASWNTAWARPGATVIRFTPIRNEKHQIVGMEAKNYAVKGVLSGVELKITDATKKYDDFGDLLIDPSTGFAYERGVLKEAEQSDKHKLHKAIKPQPSTSPSPENSQNSKSNTGGNKTTGKNGGGVQVGNQGCGTNGKEDCGGGSGTNTGNKGPKGPGKGPGVSPTPTPTETRTSSPSPTPTPTETRTPSDSPSPSPSPSESHTKDPDPNPSPTDCNDPFDPSCH